MSDENLPEVAGSGFEGFKKVNDYGAEYWSARDLQPLLGYSQWRRFENAVKKAITSCEQSGNEPSHHFASAGKLVGIGSEASREVSRLPPLPVRLLPDRAERRPAQAPNRQCPEVFRHPDPASGVVRSGYCRLERLELRKQTSEEFKALSGAAREAGVQNRMFGIFHDAGYKGLYGGLGVDAIKVRKRIPDKEQLIGPHGYHRACRQPVPHDPDARQVGPPAGP